MKNKSPSLLNLGLASVITIFIILSLSTFASLALVAARSDYALSQKTAGRVTQVYAACSEGEYLRKDIDDMLIKSYNSMKDASYEEYCTIIMKQLDDSGLADYTFKEDKLTLTADITVNDTQVLHVELEPVLPDASQKSFHILKQWKIQTTTEWEQDDSLKLLNPSDIPGR